MAHLSFLLVAAVALAAAAHATDYCSIKCWSGEPHTVCAHPSAQPSSACGEVASASLGKNQARRIVRLHNKYRARVASGRETRGAPGPQPAGRIPQLKWDDELATIAQRWANQCQINHDRCRNVDRYVVNQNIAWNKWTDKYRPNITDLVQGWYDEVQDFDSRLVSNYQSNYRAVTTHYTQMIWAKTTHIGCGLIKYREGEWYVSYLVCNYGPMGNMIGEKVYETV